MAIIIPALPYTLTNGTTADANQVMADLNDIVTGVNNNAAHNGPNSDITSLTGLTTPLTIAQGGTGVGAVGAVGTIPVSDGTAFAWSNTVNGPLTITGAVNLNGTPNNIKGVTDGSDATAGQIGEIISANQTSNIPLTSNVSANVTSLVLSAGDWDVTGEVNITPSVGGANSVYAAINSVSATYPLTPSIGTGRATLGITLGTFPVGMAIRPCRVSIAASATYYLIAQLNGQAGNAIGNIWARRVR
jgi:hypothetical protein